MSQLCDPWDLLPDDHEDAILIGRVFDPEDGGPSVVTVSGDQLVDLTDSVATVSELAERPDRIQILESLQEQQVRTWSLAEVLTASVTEPRAATSTVLISPVDLHVIKAAGVTFAQSMVERVVEEQSRGNASDGDAIRETIGQTLGGAISDLRPGSAEAGRVKEILVSQGLWSQYLEVGIGPDPEIFTKAPVLSTIGPGAPVGVLARSTWNNPEPEVVLVVNSAGYIIGATLGNDVNLRDFEGRSALLLPQAKDNNASCAVGPFIRLFDDNFGSPQVSQLVVNLEIDGYDDGFQLSEDSSMSEISRTPEELVSHTLGAHHQYPDGFALFTGTLFAPTADRDHPGMGFTHHRADKITIRTPMLGALVNRVSTAEDVEDWRFGIRQLFANLSARGLLPVEPTGEG